MATNKAFAERLTALRENTGKKRQEVADDLKISRASLEYYEKGKRKPDIEVLVRLADYYGVSTDYLLGLSDVSTTDKDIKFICNYTGLSETSVKILNSANDLFKLEYMQVINFLIEEIGLSYANETIEINENVIGKIADYFFYDYAAEKQNVCVTSFGKIYSSKKEFENNIMDSNKKYYFTKYHMVPSNKLLNSYFLEQINEFLKKSKQKYVDNRKGGDIGGNNP